MYVGILLREFTLITTSTLVHSFLITLCVAMPGTAQGRGDTDRAGVGRAPPYSYVRSSLHVRRSAGFADGNGSGAFLMEAAGGALGSAAGIGIVALASNCGIDDLACAIKTVGAGGLLGTIGATIGTTIAARQTGSGGPSSERRWEPRWERRLVSEFTIYSQRAAGPILANTPWCRS